MRNLFQSSLLATLLVFLNSTLLRSTGYPESTRTQHQQCVISLTAVAVQHRVLWKHTHTHTHTHTEAASTVCHVPHSCHCATQGTLNLYTHIINCLSHYYCWSLLYSAILRSRADSLHSHVILHEWIAFIARFWISTEVVYLQRWHGWCHMKLLPSWRILCTPCNHAPCHFMQSHIRKV